MMNKELLKDLYTEREMKKQAISFYVKKYHKELYDEIMNIDINYGFLAKAYCYIYSTSENPKCHCGKETKFISMVKGFSKTCSSKCMGMVDETKEKRMKTTQEKYGVNNISLVTRDKVSEILKNKSDEEKKEIDDKRKQSYIKKYGVNNPNKSRKIRDKTKHTNIEKYGVEYPTQSKDVIKTRTKNNIKKYGVESPTQLPEIFEKAVKNGYRRKEYKWKTGEISIIQGYEDKVLRDLEYSGYTFNQVKTDSIDMPEFFYYLDGKKKRYFPDIFIPEENKVIEVKSNYTIKCNLEKNKLKFESVRQAGYNFELIVK